MDNRKTTPDLAAWLRCAAFGVALVAAAAVVHVRVAAQDLSQLVSTATPGQAAVLSYNNRPITVLRATVLSRPPAERAQAAAEILDRIVNDGTPGTVSSRQLQGVSIISVGTRDVFALVPLDVNELAGETQEAKTAEAVGRLQQAIDEAIELRTPSRIATSTAWALLATVIFGILLWATRRLHRGLVERASRSAERRLKQLSAGDVLVKVSRAPDVARRVVTGLFIVAVAVHRLQLADLRPAAVPLHASMGRIPAIVPARSARPLRHGDRQRHSRPVHGLPDPADHPLRGAALPGDVPRGGGRPAVASLRVSRDGTVDTPAGDGADLAAWPRPRLSLSAGQQLRRLQGRQRLPRRRALTRVERHRQPDHERPHHHLFARRTRRRLRQDRRRRGHDHASWARSRPRSRRRDAKR